MRFTYSATLLIVALAVGCSSSEVTEVAETAEQVKGLAATLPLVTEFEKPDSGTDEQDEPIAPFEENLDFFTPPKMIIPIEIEEPEDTGGELPPLRLVGFVGSPGDKAMVEVDGKTQIVTAGKRVNGVEIVSVESPNVQLRWGETELTLNFYEPSKSDRPKVTQNGAVAYSPGLSSLGSRAQSPSTTRPTASKPPAPRPRVSLPALPGLPKPRKAGDVDFPEFPDLGAGPPVAPPSL